MSRIETPTRPYPTIVVRMIPAVHRPQSTASRVAQTTTDVDATSTELLAASNEQMNEIQATGKSVLDVSVNLGKCPKNPPSLPKATASCTGVWVVVDRGNGQTTTRCATKYGTGLEALKSAGFKVEAKNGFIDRIHGFPFTIDTTFTNYWGYWSATPKADGTWNTWTSVTERADLFKGRAGYTGIDKANKNALAITLGFTPTWYQVFPSVDMTLPMAYSRGLYGNSAVSLGGNEGAGNYSFGVGAVYQNKYIFDLRYIDYFGGTAENAAGTVTAGNGLNAYNQDRGWLVFNFKTTF